MHLMGTINIERKHVPGEAADLDMWEVSLLFPGVESLNIRFPHRFNKNEATHEFASAFAALGAELAQREVFIP
jgi:hypothetical protein